MATPVIDESAIVCTGAVLQGNVKVGPGCVIHPKASIICATTGDDANGCSIVLGANNIVEENAIISIANGMQMSLVVGDNNLVSVGAVVEGSLGNCNTVQCKARVGPGMMVASNCVIGVACSVEGSGCMPDNTVVYGRP